MFSSLQGDKFLHLEAEHEIRIIRSAKKFIGTVSLKTMDLIIMSAVIDFKPDIVYSFDQVFNREYTKNYAITQRTKTT